VLLVPSMSIMAKYFMPEELTRSRAAILVEVKIMLAFFSVAAQACDEVYEQIAYPVAIDDRS